MENKKLELINLDDVLKKVEEVRKKACASNENLQECADRLDYIDNLLNEQNELRKDYVVFFAAILREIRGEQKFDKDLQLEDKLVNFTRTFVKHVGDFEVQKDSFENEKQAFLAEREAFLKEKTDRDTILAQMKEECKKQAEAETKKELQPLQTELAAKKEELEKIKQKIETEEKKLDDIKNNLEQFGPATITAPPADRPFDEQKILNEFDKEGFVAPSEIQPFHLYLCTAYNFVDVTSSPTVVRAQLMELDETEFAFTGKPQIIFKQQNGGWVALPQKLKNTINGALLEEETELPQGAIIKMTDKRGDEHTVKVLIGM